jgi:hypothetical protein
MPVAAARTGEPAIPEIPPRGSWLANVLRRPQGGTVSAPPAPDDTLEAFPSEHPAARAHDAGIPAPSARHTWRWTVSVGLVLLAAGAGVAAIGLSLRSYGAVPALARGTLTIETEPSGAEISIDGTSRGTTPVTLSLSTGSHSVVLRRVGEERILPVTIRTGADVTQYVEFAPGAAAAALVGKLTVTTDPPAARVQIDGRARGTSPLLVEDLDAGEHTVAVAGDAGSVERRVRIEAGATASVVFSLPKQLTSATGWLTVSGPFEVRVFENNDLVGLSGSKIMLPAGRHDLRIVNADLGYEQTSHVEVTAGKVAAFRVDPPKVTINANARPWADLIIDGVEVGQTPLANLQLTVGPHEIVFRHPQLGNRRQTLVVTTRGPNRVSVDLTKP